uniref:dihydroxyacetone kinase subunit DhaK n=1 Tax=Lutibacter sp. TaxID=1925666 RepID=UPI00356AF265
HTSCDEITAILTNAILDDDAYTRQTRTWNFENSCWDDKELTNAPFKSGDKMIALVNGLGGTPLSELYGVYRKMHQICESKNIEISRKIIGSYITALDMQGCSITLVKVDDEILKLWDAPVKTPGLRWGL